MTQVTNKTSLITFIVNKWRKPESREKIKEKIVYATVNDKCYKITSRAVRLCHLSNVNKKKQMAAYFYADHAARDGDEAVVICSEDTYVFI